MGKDKKPDRLENLSLDDVYDVRLIFKKTGHENKVVTVAIRYTKIGHARKREFSSEEMNEFLREDENIKNRNYIEDADLCWTIYHKERIAVYHRRKFGEYTDMNHSIAPTSLGDKLEKLVFETHRT